MREAHTLLRAAASAGALLDLAGTQLALLILDCQARIEHILEAIAQRRVNRTRKGGDKDGGWDVVEEEEQRLLGDFRHAERPDWVWRQFTSSSLSSLLATHNQVQFCPTLLPRNQRSRYSISVSIIFDYT